MQAVISIRGQQATAATVARIEPAAYTKMSALGIEEQRVRVVPQLTSNDALGDGHKVTGRIIMWHVPRALRVPSNALVISQADTSVNVVIDGRAQPQRIQLGARSMDAVEVIGGIEKGTTVVINPPSSLGAGSHVVAAE